MCLFVFVNDFEKFTFRSKKTICIIRLYLFLRIAVFKQYHDVVLREFVFVRFYSVKVFFVSFVSFAQVYVSLHVVNNKLLSWTLFTVCLLFERFRVWCSALHDNSENCCKNCMTLDVWIYLIFNSMPLKYCSDVTLIGFKCS